MNRIIFIYGFALFGMFFGAGNLVFPLSIGMSTGGNWLWGLLGLVITAVILPFLGLFAVKLYKGDYFSFFGNAGNLAKILLPAIMLTLIGSFGGMPRCVTVAYGGMKQLIPDLSLFLFSIAFCAITYFICMSEGRILNVVGKWMSPVLLFFLVVLIILGAMHSSEFSSSAYLTATESFRHGLTSGYQTMDLLSAFFFSAWIFAQIQQMLPKDTSDKNIMKISIKSGIVAMAMLGLMYMGLVFLGANFSQLIANTKSAEMIATITNRVMGSYAAPFIGILITIACLTTVVALNSIYAQYLCVTFKCKDKFHLVLMATTTIAFFVSLFDFNGITKFLSPVLEVLYPSLITLTVACIFIKTQTTYRLHMTLFYGMLAIVLFFRAIAT